MAEKTIMLVCSAGMSTSLLVTKMEKAAAEKGLDAEIFAVSASEADATIQSKHPDVVMLGPQVRFMKDQFEEKLAGTGIGVEVINMQDYGMMNGEKVLNHAVELIESK
ncbi:PTS sugar transporter subunit IIB [Allofustis seminis]|uniref:PTS sugar transporter subunit IIB n=1 Tax=Allofustis seminis TaxID=166939 RepID=UPI00036B93A3|nr:PTS sugar transporter subunit IIB [Allofustis seminis]